jgi:hypothetical protein
VTWGREGFKGRARQAGGMARADFGIPGLGPAQPVPVGTRSARASPARLGRRRRLCVCGGGVAGVCEKPAAGRSRGPRSKGRQAGHTGRRQPGGRPMVCSGAAEAREPLAPHLLLRPDGGGGGGGGGQVFCRPVKALGGFGGEGVPGGFLSSLISSCVTGQAKLRAAGEWKRGRRA